MGWKLPRIVLIFTESFPKKLQEGTHACIFSPKVHIPEEGMSYKAQLGCAKPSSDKVGAAWRAACLRCPLGLDCPTAEKRKAAEMLSWRTCTCNAKIFQLFFECLFLFQNIAFSHKDSALVWSAIQHKGAYPQALPSQQSSCTFTLAWLSVLPNQGTNCTAPWKDFCPT